MNRDNTAALIRKRAVITTALELYKFTSPSDPARCTVGYNILRWASQGLLMSTKNETDRFVSWYPLNGGYVILRLASEGKLKCSLEL